MVSLRASWEAAYPDLDLSKGITKGGMGHYRLLDESSPSNLRAAFPYLSLRALCDATHWPTAIHHVGDNPRAVESRWTNETNGLVHDDAFWYVVTAKLLFKIPITVPLGEAKGSKVFAPKEQPGWPHGGGCALHKGFLYVAVHEMVAGTIPNGQVWVVDPASLTVVDKFDLDLRMEGDHLVPWVAIHPTKDLLYTMNFSLGTLRVYRLFPLPGEKGPDGKRAVLLGTLTLTDEAGERLSLWHIQSGIITPNNHLPQRRRGPTRPSDVYFGEGILCQLAAGIPDGRFHSLPPAYTGADRQELSVEHAALLATICSALPGAHVTALVRGRTSGVDSRDARRRSSVHQGRGYK